MSDLNENGKRPISTVKARSSKTSENSQRLTADQRQSRKSTSSNQSDPKPNGLRGEFSKAQAKINQIQEAEQMREWVSKEDDFMLQQSKKKARIRIKEGRAKTVDKLIVTLGAAAMTESPSEEEEEEEVVEDLKLDPLSLLENLDLQEIRDLTKAITSFVFLEKHPGIRKLWKVSHIVSPLFVSDHVDRPYRSCAMIKYVRQQPHLAKVAWSQLSRLK